MINFFKLTYDKVNKFFLGFSYRIIFRCKNFLIESCGDFYIILIVIFCEYFSIW